MSKAKIFFRSEATGKLRKAPVGFSWTTLFFGPLVPLLRRDFEMFFIMVIMITLTFGLGVFYFAFAYNKIYINHLISKGFYAEKATGVSAWR